jgi:TolB-like protein/Tfp pilus assembly protein PilF
VVAALGSYGLWRVLAPSSDRTGEESAIQDVIPDRKMIVVLPFENLGEPEDGYFADGITEEITSRLATLNGLGVISRTSAMQYKGARPSVRRIGEELGVDYVLEGTVRWQRSSTGPSRVRVTPQLIQVSDDSHLWAERYDRVLADIFEVQSDIARQVSNQLGIALLEPQRRSLQSRPTGSLEAYDSYLRGNDYLNRGRELRSPEAVHFAIGLYEDAIRLDPKFALAHARLSVAHGGLYDDQFDYTEERLSAAQAAVDRALELDPELPEAHYALGLLLYAGRQDPERALAEFQRVLRSQPNNAEVYEAISTVQQEEGRMDEGLASLKRAMELNPKLGRLPCSVGGTYFATRDFEKALLYHDQAIRLTPDRSCPYVCKLWIHLNQDGSTENARAFLSQIPTSIGLEETPPIIYPLIRMEMIDGRYEEALERLSSGPSKVLEFQNFFMPKELLAAQIYGLLGRTKEEKAHYEAARDLLEIEARERPEDSRIHSALAIAYAGIGRAEEAVREAKLGLALPGRGRGSITGYRRKDLAQVYVMIGEFDAAIDQLEHLLSTPSFFAAPYLKVEPTWRPLLDHTRFQALLEKYSPKAG